MSLVKVQVIVGNNRKTTVLVDNTFIYESDNSPETEKKNIQKLLSVLDANAETSNLPKV